jgi:membrane protein implicated in regulation of membrane protease activity
MGDPQTTPGSLSRPPKRFLITIAVGLLLLDGVLLLLAAYWTRSLGMALLGVLLVAMALATWLYYRRFLRALVEVQQAKEELRAELAELRRLVNERDKPK